MYRWLSCVRVAALQLAFVALQFMWRLYVETRPLKRMVRASIRGATNALVEKGPKTVLF